MFKFTDFRLEEAVWPNGLGTGLEGSSPAPTTELVQLLNIFCLFEIFLSFTLSDIPGEAKRIDHYKNSTFNLTFFLF